MTKLKFVLGDRQSACFVRFIDCDDEKRASTRTLFFVAEPEGDAVVNGKACQATGHTVEIHEIPGEETSGVLESSDALDAYGKPTMVQAAVTLRLPEKMFQQLLDIDLKRSTVYLHIDAEIIHSEMSDGYDSSSLRYARISFLAKEQQKTDPVISNVVKSVDRILWAVIIIGILVIWRLR